VLVEVSNIVECLTSVFVTVPFRPILEAFREVIGREEI